MPEDKRRSSAVPCLPVGTAVGTQKTVGTEMAQEINRLTAAFIKNAKPGKHPDGGGLWLEVKKSRTGSGEAQQELDIPL
jgi:hypothetical protein